MENYMMGQIHDELLYDLCPSEQDHIFEVTRRVMCEDIQQHSWLIVPLDIDIEITNVDTPWFYKEEIKA